MVGRQGDTSVWHPAGAARAMKEWFETLPFHRGMSLLGIAVLVPAVVIGGNVVLGDGAKHPAARPPGSRGGVNAAEVPRPTWGTYVPPRTTVPTPARTQRGSMTLVRPSPVPTVTRARPSPSTSCPPSLKKWRWLWEMCRRDNGGHDRR